ASYVPVRTGLHVLEAFFHSEGVDWREGTVYPNQQCETESDICWIDRLSGDRDVRLQLEAGVDPDEIIAGWADELAAFDAVAADYRLYQDAVSVEDVRAALDGYVAGGAVAGPLAHQLATALDQVERHLDDGRAQPAQRALDR